MKNSRSKNNLTAGNRLRSCFMNVMHDVHVSLTKYERGRGERAFMDAFIPNTRKYSYNFYLLLLRTTKGNGKPPYYHP